MAFLRRQIFRFCTALYMAAFYPQWQWRHVLVTVECFCDCEEVWSYFFRIIKAVNIKIPWAFLKFSKIHECKKVSTSESPTPSIFAQKRGRIVHTHKKLRNLELCVILNVYKKTISPQIHIDWQLNNWNELLHWITERSMRTHFVGVRTKLLLTSFYDFLQVI